MKINIEVVKSILGSLFLKLSSALVSFLVVPLLLKTLATDNYAVWVTLTAMVGWITLFDFGAGYSLKNKITELKAINKEKELQILLAGTIQFYLLTTIVLFLVFLSAFFFIKIFQERIFLTLCIYIPIIISFPFTLGNFILQGLKKFNLLNLILLGQVVVWLLIILLFRYNVLHASLEKLAIIYGLLYLVTNFLLFTYAIKNIRFHWAMAFQLSHIKESKKTIYIGLRFFALQVSSLILYSIGNILTYDHLSLQNVAQYDTVNKIFLLFTTLFNVIISVFWTEISQAKALFNSAKLLKLYKQLLFIATLYCCGVIVAAIMLPSFIKVWTKNIIDVSIHEIYPFIILACIQAFAYVGAVFLNAFEELKEQIIFSILASISMLPLAFFFFKLNMGIGTVPLSAAIVTFPAMIYVLIKAGICIKKITPVANV